MPSHLINLENLKGLFSHAGAVRLYAKPLAENDNSKNQVYFGPNFQVLNLFPNRGVFPDSSPKNPIFKARLDMGWLTGDGKFTAAPHAQFILYPQYPEVRFSGFLKGCAFAPSELMGSRQKGRILFLGVSTDRRVMGYVVGADSPVAAEFNAQIGNEAPSAGVFYELPMKGVDEVDSRTRLLAELGRIHRLEWIESKQLDEHGNIKPCRAAQCGGFTLEAELGIPKNSNAEPDFLGWEVKQYAVMDFSRPDSGNAITLMTPEPTGGFYKEKGVEAFIRKYGYPDKQGRPDRLNFGGTHRYGQRHPNTGLEIQLSGYDFAKKKITDANGALALIARSGDIAASWAFSGLLAHWSRKHSKAVYVPSKFCAQDNRYSYGNKVRLAEQTDSLCLLEAVASGNVYYDPGIKLENASTKSPKVKRRSQFRIQSKNINVLYMKVEIVDVI